MNDPQPEPSGALLVNKPAGMTSHDVVDRIRRAARTRRAGHAGTLDPMATGLLVIVLGRATRIAQFLTGLDKEYEGEIVFGAISSTYDAEGDIEPQDRPVTARIEDLAGPMRALTGWLTQLPPPYSAVKVKGKKLYEYAREGLPAPEKPRRVWIRSFEALEYAPPRLRFRARTGSGVYVRSMAHDLGLALGCGAHLSALIRTRCGRFSLDQAVPLAAIMERPELVWERLLSPAEALGHLPKLTVGEETERRILNGRAFTTREILACETLPRPAEDTLVVNERGRVLSIARGEPDPALGPAIGSAEEDSAASAGLLFKHVCVLGKD